MKKEPIFTYENGVASCTVEDKYGRVFTGKAYCADEDKQFESMLVGSTIAENRARIAVAKAYRDDLKIRIEELMHLYSTMEQSKKFNRQSYEAKRLYQEINLLNNDLNIAKHQLAVLKLDLYEFIKNKEDLHNRLIKNRKNEEI